MQKGVRCRVPRPTSRVLSQLRTARNTMKKCLELRIQGAPRKTRTRKSFNYWCALFQKGPTTRFGVSAFVKLRPVPPQTKLFIDHSVDMEEILRDYFPTRDNGNRKHTRFISQMFPITSH